MRKIILKKADHHPLKRWRFEYGLSGEKAANLFGINKAYLSEIEGRKKAPTLGLAEKIVLITEGSVQFPDLVLRK